MKDRFWTPTPNSFFLSKKVEGEFLGGGQSEMYIHDFYIKMKSPTFAWSGAKPAALTPFIKLQ